MPSSAAAANEGSKPKADAVAVDCYVCGSANLLAEAGDAFDEKITPVCTGSAFFGLHYAIG